MQPRSAGARRSYCSGALCCAALTLYSTWPYAQTAAQVRALGLKPSLQLSQRALRSAPSARAIPLAPGFSFELSAPPELALPPAEPLALKLSFALTEPRDLPFEAAEGISIRLSLRLGDAISAVAQADRLLAPDLRGAQPVFYAVRVNRQEVGVARLLRLRDGRWLARRSDLEEWRLRVPDSSPVLFGGEEYYPLDTFQGFALRLDEARQELHLDIAPRYFAATVLDSAATRLAQAVPPGPGGFVNYDLVFNATREAKGLGGLFEAGVFNRFGVGTSGLLLQDVGENSSLVRLDTTWRRDFPAEMKTLLIGDAIGSSGIWGRPVRFGGVRYGTNFETNPGFVTFPLPGLRGEAALPTTTELYVNGMLRQSSSVPPGPFQINNLPVITGQGDVRLVVRDMLGREQVITMPYYTSSQLLRAGLTEESYEVGVVRENFGIRSFDYGRFVAAFQGRKGYSDDATGEARLELLGDQQTAGLGGSVALRGIGLATGAFALSRSTEGNGALLFVGFERQVLRGVSFGARSQWASPDFTQLGLQPGEPAPSRVMSGNIGYSPPGYGSFGVSYVRQDNRNLPRNEIVGASYSLSIGRSIALILFGSKPLSGEGEQVLGVTLSMGFGERTSASVGYTAQANANEALVQLQQNLPTGSGLGYRVVAGLGEQNRQEAGLAWQTDIGTYGIEAARVAGSTAVRASASGGIAVLDGRPFLARGLTDSFGVAHVPGFPGVGIYLNNQRIASTDAQGYAMLPRLLPYQANPVRIETADLPLDTQINATELDAVPYFRSGLLLKFPIQRANGALLILVLDDGAPMPVGSLVNIVGGTEQFIVAERGEVYVTGLAEKNRLRATVREQSCEFNVQVGTELGTQPRIGPVTCAGVKR